MEAGILSRVFKAEVTGIDLDTRFDPMAEQVAKLQWGDATSLEFETGSFDLVYSYHALEHIRDYRKALGEMRRVLSRNGWYCIGVPNRSRLIGYLGAEATSIAEKIKWNVADWKARMTGRFRNELGAHAGFTLTELTQEVTASIGDAEDITLKYYLSVYPGLRWVTRILAATGLGRFLFPAVYVIGRKRHFRKTQETAHSKISHG